MLFFLNIALVMSGTVTAGSAIIGETRANGRFTRIGWIAIIGCAVTLIVGIAKERVTEQETIAKETAAQQEAKVMAEKVDLLVQRTRNLEKLNEAQVVETPTAKLPSKEQLVMETRTDPTVHSGEFSGQLIKREGGWDSSTKVQLIASNGDVVGTVRPDQEGNFRFKLPSGRRARGGLNLLFSATGKQSLVLKGIKETPGMTVVIMPLKVDDSRDN